MSQQFDILSGKDFSALSSLSQEDLMQGINQAAPLDNVGFIIVSTTRPDITANPRFIRFLWLDISTPSNPQIKRYDGDRVVLADIDASWGSITLEDLAVITSSFALRSATGGVNVALIKLNADYSATLSSSYYIIRVAANGKDIEAVSLSQALLDGGGVPLIRLDTTGLAAGKFIGFSGGVAGYVPIVPSTDLIGAARIAAETNILPGTDKYILKTVGTTPVWAPAATLFDNNSLPVASLLATGAAINDILRYNGTIWEKVTPGLRIVLSTDTANAGIASSVVDTITTGFDVAHGITGGIIPRISRAVLKNISGGVATGTGHAANSEVPLENFIDVTSPNEYALTCSVDTTNFTITTRRDYFAGNNIMGPKVGAPGAMANITKSQWQLKLYAWG